MARSQTTYARSQRAQTHPKHRQMDMLTLGLLGLFGILAIACAIVFFIVLKNLFSPKTTSPIKNAGAPSAPVVSAKTPESAPVSTTWNGYSRINILLMGLDYNDYHDSGNAPSRTDSMMLVTFDPATMTAGMLSLPRDMWVSIPNYGEGKINTAYFLGEANHVEGGGPALAMKTVENFLGVPVNYYVVIKFDAFVKFIDTIGGVIIVPDQDMEIEAMNDNRKEVPLKAGQAYTLEGKYALAYARDRHSTPGGDFDRAHRQQQVIMAIRNRILNYNELGQLISKAPEIYNELSSGLQTNLSIPQIINLAQVGVRISPDKIQKVVIGPEDAPTSFSYDGQSIDVPIPERIRVLRDQIFSGATASDTGSIFVPAASSDTNAAPTAPTGDILSQAKGENARISVQNGTTTGGLAGDTGAYLTQQGFNVVDTGNADQNYSDTTIMVYTSKPYTLSYLAKLFSVPSSRIINRLDPNAGADITVIIGEDWASSNPLGQ